MKNGLFKQALIIGMMLLFVGSFVASATSSTLTTKKETNENSESLINPSEKSPTFMS